MLPVRFFLFVLHDLLHEVSHGLGRFVLLLPGGGGVGAQGEAGIEVSQHEGDRFHVHAVLQGCGGEGVTEIVESEMLQSDVLQDLLVEVYYAVRVVHLSSQGRGEQVGAVWVFAVLLDQQIHRCLWDGYQPHGVLCLGLGHFQRTVRVADILLSNGDRPLLNIQIVPPQGHQFPLPQTADQFQIEHW